MNIIMERNREIVNTFLFFRSNPLGEMWFVIVLFELMLLYPIYKLIINNSFSAILGLGGNFDKQLLP